MEPTNDDIEELAMKMRNAHYEGVPIVSWANTHLDIQQKWRRTARAALEWVKQHG